MSRNFIPVALAIGVGVYTGIYLTFVIMREISSDVKLVPQATTPSNPHSKNSLLKRHMATGLLLLSLLQD
jgi:hypothetical protein